MGVFSLRRRRHNARWQIKEVDSNGDRSSFAVWHLSVPAFANSAQYYWADDDQSRIIIVDGDSLIIVEKELLTFDLQEFTKNQYVEAENFLTSIGKVTIEYEIYNPSNMTMTAK